jgi:hypothetical protein
MFIVSLSAAQFRTFGACSYSHPMQIYKLLIYDVGYIDIYTEFYYDQDRTDIKHVQADLK